MTERKRRKSEITSERLLGICLEQFQKKGFDKTTMRDLAEAAELSPGAFYYHFKSKEAVVQVFYERSFEDFRKAADEVLASSTNFEERLTGLIRARLSTFKEHRPLLIVLSRSAVDPTSELSPFTEGTREIRDLTIQVVADAMNGSDLKADKKLLPFLPRLLWMYLMSFVLFWVFDESKNQTKTDQLIAKLTPLIVRLIRFSRFPLTGSVIDPIVDTLKLVLEPAIPTESGGGKRKARSDV